MNERMNLKGYGEYLGTWLGCGSRFGRNGVRGGILGGKRIENGDKWKFEVKVYGCDHTSTNAPDPIRTPQLSVLGRE